MSSANLDNISVQVLQKLWESSPYLNSAYWYYQRKDVKAQYNALKKEGGPAAQSKLFSETIKNPDVTNKAKNEVDKQYPDGPIGIMDTLGSILTRYNELHKHSVPEKKEEYEALRKSLKKTCLKWIRDGKLLALGFPKDRRPNDKACLVPFDLIDQGHFDWNNNEIFNYSLKMIDIRIANPKNIPATGENLNSEKIFEDTKFKKYGRNSRKKQITEAYFSLFSAGTITHNSTAKHFVYEIQNWVKSRYEDPPTPSDGLSHETIRRTVRDIQNNTK